MPLRATPAVWKCAHTVPSRERLGYFRLSSGRFIRWGPSAFGASGDCPRPAAGGCPRPGRLLSPLLSTAFPPRPDKPLTCGTCAGTPRPLTRSTTCACRAVVVTSTPGTARSTHARRVDSRWSLLDTTSRPPVGGMTPGGPRLRQFSGRDCATRVSRPAGARGSRSSGHERAPKSGCGVGSPAALGCRRLRQ